jgi:luciferase family oxidoreductase group 1
LLAFSDAGEEFPLGHPFRAVKAMPNDVPLPPIWLLGSSDYSAQEAGALGVGFAFAHHINATFAVPAIQLYRATFKPSERLQKPYVILTTSVICADTDEQAESLADAMGLTWVRLRSGRPAPIASPEEAKAYHYTAAEREIVQDHRGRQMIGRPEVVREKLLQLVEETGADELMISAMVYGYENRVRAYKLLAEAFDLQHD